VKDAAILAITAAEAQGTFGHCAYKKVSGSLGSFIRHLPVSVSITV
jgi:hypothetical protein